MSPGAIMRQARVAARDETIVLPGLAAEVGHADPLDALIERIAPVARRSVDALQVAAALESAGVTDRAARVAYGFVDVFDLAAEVCRRVDTAPDPAPPGPARQLDGELRDISHGALYLLPAAIFPAALAALGRPAVASVVLIAAIGWVWSGAVAWLAYQLLSKDRPGSAGRLLRTSALAALAVAALAGGVLAVVTGASVGLVALALLQMAYQMAATVLVFYHREDLVFVAMLPALVSGAWYLIAGSRLLPVAIGLGAASVILAYGLAIHQATRRIDGLGRGWVGPLRGHGRAFAWAVAFTGLSAAFFLVPQTRNLADGFGVAVAALPVIVGMGVVEWRARRFGPDARLLLARTYNARQFVVRVWLLVLSGLAICLLTVAGLAVLLLVLLAGAGQLNRSGVVVAAAAVLLGGAYFLGFLLANLGRYDWLCGSLLLALATYLLAGSTVLGALSDHVALLSATALLLTMYLTALATCLGEAHRHR